MLKQKPPAISEPQTVKDDPITLSEIQEQPTAPEPPAISEDVLTAIMVPSSRVSHRTFTQPGKGTVKLAYGSINGESFEVECDTQVFVKPEVAEVLRHAIGR